MRRPAGTGDDNFQAPPLGGACIIIKTARSTMCRDDTRFIGHFEAAQHLCSVAQSCPVRLAAHDDTNKRRRRRHGCSPLESRRSPLAGPMLVAQAVITAPHENAALFLPYYFFSTVRPLLIGSCCRLLLCSNTITIRTMPMRLSIRLRQVQHNLPENGLLRSEEHTSELQSRG